MFWGRISIRVWFLVCGKTCEGTAFSTVQNSAVEQCSVKTICDSMNRTKNHPKLLELSFSECDHCTNGGFFINLQHTCLFRRQVAGLASQVNSLWLFHLLVSAYLAKNTTTNTSYSFSTPEFYKRRYEHVQSQFRSVFFLHYFPCTNTYCENKFRYIFNNYFWRFFLR